MGGDDSSYFMEKGPVGHPGGNPWDEKGNDKVVQIFLSNYEDIIDSIQFQYYAENGTLVLSDRYGSHTNWGSNFDAVRLNYATEYITGIAGQRTNSYIRSITFSTNLREYGPFGRSQLGEYGPFGRPQLGEYGQFGQSQPTTNIKEFNIKLGRDLQFGGFHGTADSGGLLSIGLYLKPIMNLEYPPTGNIIELTDYGRVYYDNY